MVLVILLIVYNFTMLLLCKILIFQLLHLCEMLIFQLFTSFDLFHILSLCHAQISHPSETDMKKAAHPSDDRIAAVHAVFKPERCQT